MSPGHLETLHIGLAANSLGEDPVWQPVSLACVRAHVWVNELSDNRQPLGTESPLYNLMNYLNRKTMNSSQRSRTGTLTTSPKHPHHYAPVLWDTNYYFDFGTIFQFCCFSTIHQFSSLQSLSCVQLFTTQQYKNHQIVTTFFISSYICWIFLMKFLSFAYNVGLFPLWYIPFLSNLTFVHSAI